MNAPSAQKNLLFFLNRVFHVASHLAERLDELKEIPLFEEFQSTITAAIISLEQQLDQIDNIFAVFGETTSLSIQDPLILIMENAFSRIYDEDSCPPILALLDYVSLGNSIMSEGNAMANLAFTGTHDLKTIEPHLNTPAALQPLMMALQEMCSAV